MGRPVSEFVVFKEIGKFITELKLELCVFSMNMH